MSELLLDHPLDSRHGLSDSLAYLRDTYPQVEWAQHDNFGQLASFWLDVHDGLRAEGAQLRQVTDEFREGKRTAAEFQRYSAPRIGRFLQGLNGHHHVEDAHYFPKFRALDPRMVAGFDLLERDHATIHTALVASAPSAQRFLNSIGEGPDAARRGGDSYSTESDRLLSLLLRHLSDEEDLIVPAILHHGERSVS